MVNASSWASLRQRGRRRLLQALCALPCALTAGRTFAQPQRGAPETSADRQFIDRFGDTFLDDYWRYNPDAAIAVGYYAVDTLLTVPDAAYRQQYRQFLERSLTDLHAIAQSGLGSACRTDWAVLDSQLRYELWSLLELREWQWNPAQYNVADAFGLMLETPYAPLEQRLRHALERMRHVPAYYAAARAAIDAPTREHTTLAIEQSEGTLTLLQQQLPRSLAAASLSPAERAAGQQTLQVARDAVTHYVEWLRTLLQAERAPRSFRLGAAAYAQKFAFVHQSGESAEALYRRALQEREQVLARMEALARSLWPRYFAATAVPTGRFELIGQMIDRLSQQHVSAAQFIPSIERLIPELTHWVQQHALLDIDLSKPLQVRVTPAYQRGIAIAGIDAPGPYDPVAATYFNVDPLDPAQLRETESLLREYNRWMLPVFIIHEAIPGHYVQLMHANRARSRIKSLFGNGTMIEGWAVYSERMMLESGYDDSPEQWLIYWKWYLRSVTNTVLDYGVHVLGMSAAEADTLLTREAFQSAQEAANKWRRVQRSSVQLTQYFAGFSAIYRLREQQRALRGAQFDLRRFHEQFLSYGSAPVGVIATLMNSSARAT